MEAPDGAGARDAGGVESFRVRAARRVRYAGESAGEDSELIEHIDPFVAVLAFVLLILLAIYGSKEKQ